MNLTPSEKRKATMIEKYGTWEKYLEAQAINGKQGGLVSHVRPFRDVPGLAKIAGKKSAKVRKR